MKKQIWKFPLSSKDATVEMPEHAEILTVQAQGEIPCIWAIVNPDNEKELRHFEIYGTGHDLTASKKKYIGTFQVNGGAFVYHLFERI